MVVSMVKCQDTGKIPLDESMTMVSTVTNIHTSKELACLQLSVSLWLRGFDIQKVNQTRAE